MKNEILERMAQLSNQIKEENKHTEEMKEKLNFLGKLFSAMYEDFY